MKKLTIILWMVLILLFLPGTMAVPGALDDRAGIAEEMKMVLEKVISDISTGLTEIDDQNARSAEELAYTDLTGEGVVDILNRKLANVPYGHSSLVITPKGKVSAAAPLIYSWLVGEDLSDQSIVTDANRKKKPVVSDVFLLEEGFFGISQSYPVLSPEKEYLGYTDVTYRPEEYLSQFIMPVEEQTRYDFLIIQPDGMMVYETNPEGVGRNVLTDPLYHDPEMHRQREIITTNESGEMMYPFWNRNLTHQVPGVTVWDTLRHGGQEWRVAISSDLEETGNGKTGNETWVI
jgi:hypothetical protein